jgi:hypothetical protein
MNAEADSMKARRATLALVVVVAAVVASESAFADRGHHRHRGHVQFGISIGAPVYWGGFWGPHWGPHVYYPGPAYYPAPVVVTPPAPQTYVEQPAAAPAQAQGYWYYCAESQTYYPYVKSCAGSWQRVIPYPPPG